MRTGFAISAAIALLASSVSVQAEPVTACTANRFCYCIGAGLQGAIDQNIAKIRERIAQQKTLGKAIGYLSVPLSTIGGSYMGLNIKVAEQSKKRIEARFGPGSVWILNPGAKGFALPDGARGPEYMLMWTKVLEGDGGLGKDFDFVYFAGPSDFARVFSLGGRGDMQKIEKYYGRVSRTDPELKKVDKAAFRNYYALRASVSFSYGSHDEWNIVRSINEKRREADKKTGLSTQLGVMFDGYPTAPALLETSVVPGNAYACDPVPK